MRVIRLKNRRVYLHRLTTTLHWYVRFEKLIEAPVRKDRVKVTEFRLSDEAMRALIFLYAEQELSVRLAG